MTEVIERLGVLLRERNRVDAEIATLISRPSIQGHIGEYIAAAIFDLELSKNATEAGFDARFRSGPHAGKRVNIKWYGRREGLLDLNSLHETDFYLVMTGPKWSTSSSRKGARPLVIDEVFLFDAESLHNSQRKRGVRIGIASSVPLAAWESARIYPMSPQTTLPISAESCRLLSLFCTAAKEFS
jgi:hypothetical protein